MSFESLCEDMRKHDEWELDWRRREFVRACKEEDVTMMLVLVDGLVVRSRKRDELVRMIERAISPG